MSAETSVDPVYLTGGTHVVFNHFFRVIHVPSVGENAGIRVEVVAGGRLTQYRLDTGSVEPTFSGFKLSLFHSNMKEITRYASWPHARSGRIVSERELN